MLGALPQRKATSAGPALLATDERPQGAMAARERAGRTGRQPLAREPAAARGRWSGHGSKARRARL